MSEHTTVLVVVALYLVLMLVIGLLARAKQQSADEYFLAGKKLPYWVVALSMNATGESAWLLLGLSGLAYVVGIHALWVVLGETLGIALSWSLVASRLNEAARHHRAVTIPDLLVSRFGDPRHLLRLTATAIVLSMIVAYVAAQLLAAGKAFEVFLDWPYTTGVLVGGAVTIAYTAVGGFRAVAYTDAGQALIMLFAVLVVPIAGIAAAGGPAAFFAELSAQEPLLDPWGASPTALAAVIAVASALAVGLPFAGAPQLLVRYMAARSQKDIRQARYISISVILLFDLGAVATGLVGRVLFPGLTDAEGIMPRMSSALFPPLVTGILVVAVLSAIMSTVSSLLTLASSALVRDLYQQTLRPKTSSRRVAILGVRATIALGLLACWIALEQPGQIFSLVLFASGGLGVAFGPPVVFALWGKRITRAGILAGMVAGFGTTVLWGSVLKEHFFGLYEVIPGVLVGVAAIVGVSAATAGKMLGTSREPAVTSES